MLFDAALEGSKLYVKFTFPQKDSTFCACPRETLKRANVKFVRNVPYETVDVPCALCRDESRGSPFMENLPSLKNESFHTVYEVHFKNVNLEIPTGVFVFISSTHLIMLKCLPQQKTHVWCISRFSIRNRNLSSSL